MTAQDHTEESADRSRKRNSLGLLQVLRSAEHWALTESEVAAILNISPSQLVEWRSAAERQALEVEESVILKLSALLGVHVALHMLLPTPANQARWWRSVCSGGPAVGQTPLDFLVHDDSHQALPALRYDLDQWLER